MQEKKVGSGAQSQTGEPANKTRCDPRVAEQSPYPDEHQCTEYDSSHGPFHVGLFNEQMQTDSKSVAAQKCIKSGNRAKGDLTNNSRILLTGRNAHPVKGDQP